MQFWGTRNIENQDFYFGKQGNKAVYFSGTGKREGLENEQIYFCLSENYGILLDMFVKRQYTELLNKGHSVTKNGSPRVKIIWIITETTCTYRSYSVEGRMEFIADSPELPAHLLFWV